MSAYPKFYFRPARGEQIETVIGPDEDGAASICGRVVDAKAAPVEDAMVLLFRAGDGAPELLARYLTDDDGHFLFGPLEPEALYLIKVFKNSVKLRRLELKTD